MIVPTFNRLAVIKRCLHSVVTQKVPFSEQEVELIVVDDGSTDGTAEYLASEFPDVIYMSQSNAGVSAARNLGLSVAQGEWIALLDSDDEWLPNKLIAQFQLLSESGLKVCHTEERWIRNGVRVNQMKKHTKRGGWIFEHCLPLCVMSPSSMLIHRSVFDTVGLFNESLAACEDYDLWLRITARYEVAYVDKACINKYGGHADQLSRQYWGMDRFRVVALENCLTDSCVAKYLSPQLQDSVRSMLTKKLTILLKGAVKHSNYELIEECNARLARLGALND